MDLSIIIVNYKTQELTSNCIDSILKSNMNSLAYEIIVVDNASEDGSIEGIQKQFPSVKTILNHENQGFSKANNLGMKAAGGDYILLLNSDTIVEANTLKEAHEFIKNHKHTGALGCKILLPSGKLDVACKRSFPTPLNGIYHSLHLDDAFPDSTRFGAYNLTYVDEDKICSIDCIMGAFMMVPRKVIDAVGMLDEDYFMYGEDVDWCYRIKNAGYQVMYYPKVRIFHHKKASGIGKRNPKVIEAFYDSMIIFYNKHYQNKYSKLTRWCVITGTSMMKKKALFKNKHRKNV
ncbi:glycosyltransferase family 2 protein [Acetobacterium bakii]|uniref:Glycosyl transferase family 2 n=1 Tax=Acetobacterium bakii TaxID=52689 RepID=A0A0L6U3I6_9FIRM|nr:glycosyltransferase family 2 protein [Acetobacterium bakii]KNZ43083.1 glycosyl transferase family 2 [Acetobacterium bakii]